MRQQATIFEDVFVGIDKSTDKLILNKSKAPLKPNVTRGVAEIYEEVKRVFTNVKALLPYINDYELITTTERLQTYMAKIKEIGYVAIDTETDGLDPISDKIAGISIYVKGENPAYIPVRHEYFDGNMSYDVIKQFLLALERYKIKIIMHNAKFDIRVLLNNFGVKVNVYYDTMIAAKLLNENEEHNLKILWAKYILGKSKQFSFSELFDDVKFSIFDPTQVFIYAALDALMTWELWEFQKDFFDKENPKCIENDLVDTSDLFYNIEMEVMRIAVDMEEYGVCIDNKYAKDMEIKYTKLLEEQEKKVQDVIESLTPVWRPNLTSNQLSKLERPIKVSSSTQMAIVIFDGLGLELPLGILKKGATRGVGKEAIAYFLEHNSEYIELWEAFSKYQKIKILLTTFIIAIPQKVNPITGRLHTTWNTMGAATGRFSSRDPNLQNIPSKNRDIRPMFIPRDGNVFVGADFNAQEPKILAHVSQEPVLLNNFALGLDVYSTLASSAYKLPYDQCTKHTKEGALKRNHGKVLLLALSYGMQVKSLSQQLKISYDEAKLLFDDFREEMHVAFEYGEKVRRECKSRGYVKTLWGRKRRFPDYRLPEYVVNGTMSSEVKKSIIQRIKRAHWRERYDVIKELEFRHSCTIVDNGKKIRECETEILNSVIQGSAVDMIKVAMVKAFHDEEFNRLRAKLVLQVHDELIVECPKENAQEVKELLSRIMVAAAASKIKDVPFTAEGDIMERWVKD